MDVLLLLDRFIQRKASAEANLSSHEQVEELIAADGFIPEALIKVRP